MSEGEFVTEEARGEPPPPQSSVNPTNGAEVGGEIRWCAGSLWNLQEMV